MRKACIDQGWNVIENARNASAVVISRIKCSSNVFESLFGVRKIEEASKRKQSRSRSRRGRSRSKGDRNGDNKPGAQANGETAAKGWKKPKPQQVRPDFDQQRRI